jgi:hypothetical protein
MLNLRDRWTWLPTPLMVRGLLPIFLGLDFLWLATRVKDTVPMTVIASGFFFLAFADFLGRPNQPQRMTLNVVAIVLRLAACCLFLAAIYLQF